MPAVMSLDPLSEYFGLFRDAFRRRDQARWAEVYCRGLLLDLPRKNVETLARHVRRPPGLGRDSATQALHNFLNHSPWDEDQVGRRYRALAAERLGRPDGVFLLGEVALAKHGAHSVGVQRQYSSALGRKLNCQLAVAVHYVSSAGSCPLALRLYLPGSWLASPERLNACGVPLKHRHRLSKAQLALQLLDEVRAEGFPGDRVMAALGHGAAGQLLEGLEQRRLAGVVEAGPDVSVAAGPAGRPESLATLARQALGQGRERLRELGLDHFEGRSWRGFHHHACLVLLAAGFGLWAQDAGP